MATCVMSEVVADGWGCMVHVQRSPCWANGEPASATPVHMGDQAGRLPSLRKWWRSTKGQRALVLHRGDIAHVPGMPPHLHEGDCWCEPELFDASPEPIPRP
jgi:hypothetical protein